MNCAVIENLGTLAFNATVDAGYTNVSTIDKDPERFGKSVLRKRGGDGKIVDTNNSTNDLRSARLLQRSKSLAALITRSLVSGVECSGLIDSILAVCL